MSHAEQQHGRDLRERLNSRRRQEKIRHLSLRSRSRSSENADRELRGPRSPPYHRRGRHERRDSRSSWPSETASSSPPLPDRELRGPRSPPYHRRGRQERRDSRSSWPSETASSSPPPPDRPSRPPFKRETDPVVLARRQKQLDYGKNTLCYQEYTKTVPKHMREPFHPRTPVKVRQTSRRRWDSAIKNWRIHLHYWNDPVKLAELRRRKDSDSDASDSDSAGTSSASVTPERRQANVTRPSQGTDATTDVKGLREPGASSVKQEPYESNAPTARRGIFTGAAAGQEESAHPVAVKQEAETPGLTLIKQERPDPQLAAAKQELLEQEPELVQSEIEGMKQEPFGEDEYDPNFSWADDVEGLAEELAGGPIV